MATPEGSSAVGPPTRSDTRLARVMFGVAFAFLVVAAPLVHPANGLWMPEAGADVLCVALAVLWAACAAEAAVGVARRDRSNPLRPVLLRALLVCVLPPARMGRRDPRSGLVWIPGIGWGRPGRLLSRRLQQAFAVPMLACGVGILPLLALEFLAGDRIRNTPGLALALQVGVSVVWVAVATEFALGCGAHRRPAAFARERVLDVMIVFLPVLAFGLLRWADAGGPPRWPQLGRALTPDELHRREKQGRLQVLFVRLWSALLLVGCVARWLGHTREKRLAGLDDEIAGRREELDDLVGEREALAREILIEQGEPDTGPTDPAGRSPAGAMPRVVPPPA